jgi:POT family proton-dependent oligopeptide transporter
MADGKYLTAPAPSTEMPPGVPYIVGNEAAERFSYYGMRTILFVFMTQYLMGRDGQPAHMTAPEATGWIHLTFASVYFFPLFGAVIADVFWGKYRTVINLSIVYCLGHLALALNETRFGLAIGLGLIAIGSGGIKPCVSSNVGDQFGPGNRHLLTRVYNWFYLAINLGSAIAMYLTPELLDKLGPKWGPHVAFGTPGLLMLAATWVFWLGRNKLVHVPPSGIAEVRKVFSAANLAALVRLLPLYVFISIWWSLYDQCSSTWVDQAGKMDRHLFGHEWLAEQFQIANPLFVLLYVPLFTLVIYPFAGRHVTLTPLRKMSAGFFFAVGSFGVCAWVQKLIDGGAVPWIGWQILAYAFLMASEILIYATGLEFSYLQAPPAMKSVIMAFFLATNSAGNVFTAAVNFFLENSDGSRKISDLHYYLCFTGLMFFAALAFVVVAQFYRGRSYIQGVEAAAEGGPVAEAP